MEVTDLVDALLKEGFSLISVYDGGEEDVAVATVQQAVEAITAVDESRLNVSAPDGRKLWLFIVLGNDLGEAVCDYVVHPLLEKVCDAHYDKYNS